MRKFLRAESFVVEETNWDEKGDEVFSSATKRLSSRTMNNKSLANENEMLP